MRRSLLAVLLLTASPTLYAQPSEDDARLKLAQQSWTSSLEEVAKGRLSMWHAYDWSRRITSLEAEKGKPRDVALKEFRGRLHTLEECVAKRVQAGAAPKFQATILGVLREEADDPKSPRAKRVLRLRPALAAMAAALQPGDTAGLTRYEAVSRYLRWQQEERVQGRIYDDEQAPTPPATRHRERMRSVLLEWLRAKTLTPAQRAVALLKLPGGSDRDALKAIVADSFERSLQTKPSVAQVDWLCRNTVIPRWRPGQGLSFGDEPEWDSRRMRALQTVLDRHVKAGKLPASVAALVAYRRLQIKEAPGGDLLELPDGVAKRVSGLGQKPTKAKHAALVADLVKLLDEREDVAVRREACWALARVGPPAPAAVEPLIRSCLSDWQVQFQNRFSPPWRPGGGAADALSTLGKAAVDPLLASLKAANPDERSDALGVLRDVARSSREVGTTLTWGDDAVVALLAAFNDPKESMHAEIADVLKELGPHAKPAVKALAERVAKDPDDDVRDACATALHALGPYAQDGVPALSQALAALDAEHSSFEAVAHALGSTGTAEAVRALVAGVNQDTPQEDRVICLDALLLCGPLAEEGLRQALAGDLRLLSLSHLADVGFGVDTAKAIANCAEDVEDLQGRVAALNALRRNALPARAVVDAVRRASKDEDDAVRTAAVSALTAIEALGN